MKFAEANLGGAKAEPHILLLADPSVARARKPKASEEFGTSRQF
ncbi:MAG: hypothetical protein OCU24_00400 [Candidatus Methanospirare jalkutatii]|nr:hypothetical protein [Candidatus Methanospirare jalkutatii]